MTPVLWLLFGAFLFFIFLAMLVVAGLKAPEAKDPIAERLAEFSFRDEMMSPRKSNSRRVFTSELFFLYLTVLGNFPRNLLLKLRWKVPGESWRWPGIQCRWTLPSSWLYDLSSQFYLVD